VEKWKGGERREEGSKRGKEREMRNGRRGGALLVFLEVQGGENRGVVQYFEVGRICGKDGI